MSKPRSMSAEMERVMRIAHEHILHSRRNPGELEAISKALGITTDAALALAIADQVAEEFLLTPND